MIAPPGIQSLAESSDTSTEPIPQKRLVLARSAWIVCVLLLLTNFVASIPAYYRLMRTVCTLPNRMPCTLPDQVNSASGQLTQGNIQALAQLHISVTTYAAYTVTVQVMVSLLFWGVGLLIFWRKSNEGLGLFVSFLLVLFGATGIGNLLGTFLPAQPPPLVQILINLISDAQWAALVAFLLTFPTGRFVPRWSWLLISLNFILDVPLLVSPDWFPIFTAVGLALSFGSAFLIAIYRYVRVSNARQRQQTKWFVYTTAIGIFLAVISTALSGVLPTNSPYQLLSTTSTLLALVPVPLGIGIAILRYRLWDIDLIIKRTLIYGCLTALLALIYFSLIFAFQFLLQGFFKQINDVSIVVSTLAIAMLFQPLRRRLQQIIDRRFYRSKYDAVRTLAEFSASLRNEADLQELSQALVAVIEETMQPTRVSLWLCPTSSERTPKTWRQ